MKKLFSILTISTLTTSTPVPLMAMIPPSLQELITTINIGEIEINDQEHIIARLREINHPILSRPDFLENMVVENITRTSAIIHARENIQSNEYPIPASINFTINFNLPTLSTIIRNRNLGNNISITIYGLNECEINFGDIIYELRRLNPNLSNYYQNIFDFLAIDHRQTTLRNTQLSLISAGLEFYTVFRSDDRINVNFNDYININVLNSILIDHNNLGEIPDNRPQTILQRVRELNPNININFFTIRENSITENSAIIQWNRTNSPFPLIQYQNLLTFSIRNSKTSDENDKELIKNKLEDNNCQTNNIESFLVGTESGNGSGSVDGSNALEKIKLTPTKEAILTDQKIFDKFNSLSKQQKQQKLNEINQHYQTLSQNDKKVFKDKLIVIGTSAIEAGIIAVGTKITVGGSASSAAVSTGEAVELTPLLSEGLTAAETLSVVEGTTAVVTEGAVIGAEAGTAAALAPETLGLSLVIGGLAITGTAIIWWLNNHENNSQAVKHELHNQYNEIEKYYKFLAHDQLKLDINSNEWNKIKQIYQENSNNYQEFKNKIKLEITNFHKENHSGWGGSITDDDINTLIKIIYNHFQEINNHFSSCGNNQGWKIVTNTIGNYFKIEQE
ncbi:hypothetical protein SKUN_001725 (plasmid) [Spiroplasma kunkelii CR2-3x]|uniref:Transmembrane protein n=1 Tax=Spiroplasma kunkelii CR2-3x TaxID=273035 RepID=A0A0K2JJ11_SPIKU|nr:hypothetical protein [Spiroplasma kunkelii]ALA98579.1 hypothetical protein SKUN_001725 [Spiroplasma kunkelii CR2-3x]